MHLQVQNVQKKNYQLNNIYSSDFNFNKKKCNVKFYNETLE